MKRERGFTLIEVVVSLALFGIFLLITAELTRQMSGYEKRMPVNFMAHPQVAGVISRLRRDVLDSFDYPDNEGPYTQGPSTLILQAVQPSGFTERVVWDFSVKGEARRRSFSVGNMTSDWVARGVPQFRVDSFEIPHHPYSVRIKATDEKGRLAIDQIFQPRRHGQP